ncbi:MAG: ABC transporter ATP-binding protein [Thermoplasmatota archaeon]
MSEPAIAARGLRKRFGDVLAVDGIDLTVERGTCFGILGPNGAGKTTTIRMIQGQSLPSEGTLTVLGLDAGRDTRAIKRRIGLVPQENNLDPDFTVRHNLMVYARYFRIPKEVATNRTEELLAFVQLNEKASSGIMELSGGMKRRLILARALVNDPEMLVLDEPTTGLDPQARHTIWDKVRRMRAEGKTILLTTHYMDEAEQLCDDLVIMDQGRILERGKPRELVARHTGTEAIEFVVPYDVDGRAVAAVAATLEAAQVPCQRLPDRVIAYGAKAVAMREEIQQHHDVIEVAARRATLEDVFLRLTGRALRD